MSGKRFDIAVQVRAEGIAVPRVPTNIDQYDQYGVRGRHVRPEFKRTAAMPTRTGKCDHERTHVDEDGERCLFCAAWIKQNGFIRHIEK